MVNNTYARVGPGIDGLRALVVGGSGGIGYAIASALAGAGVFLVLHGRQKARTDARGAELRALGGHVTTLCADLSDGLATPELLDAAASCDLLVVAYGPFVHKPLSETSPADWTRMAMGCLALPGTLATQAAGAMAARGFGRILLFGGTRTDAIRGFKTNAAYAAAKTGLGVLAKSIAVEYGSRGVSSALICPGFVDTEYLDDGLREQLSAASPRGGLIPAPEIAGLALELLSGGMDLVNGAILVADRGLYAL